jgi:hypothetical protein
MTASGKHRSADTNFAFMAGTIFNRTSLEAADSTQLARASMRFVALGPKPPDCWMRTT